MNKLIYILNLLIAAAFATAPHLDFIQRHLSLESPTSAFSWLLSIGSVLYAFTSTALFWISDQSVDTLEEAKEELEQYLRAPDIRPLRDDDFYSMFLDSAEAADSRVFISYFGMASPSDTKRRERNRYYRDIVDVMTQNRRAAFRRLVRDTSANRAWCQERFNAWSDIPNVSVAVLADLPETEEMPLALSVQIIDSSKAWLVALEGHERTGPYRDVYVSDQTFTSILLKYYERLWSHATVIVKNGALTAAGSRLQGDIGAEL